MNMFAASVSEASPVVMDTTSPSSNRSDVTMETTDADEARETENLPGSELHDIVDTYT